MSKLYDVLKIRKDQIYISLNAILQRHLRGCSKTYLASLTLLTVVLLFSLSTSLRILRSDYLKNHLIIGHEYYSLTLTCIPRTVPDTHNSSVSPANNRRYLNTPEKFWLRCCAAFFALFTAGWADGLTGSILPHIKEDFHLTYMIASLLFITSTIGFALGVITIGHVMCLLGHCRLNPIGFLTHLFSQNVISNETARANSLNDGMHSTRVTSPTRARFRILVLASILHAFFFILMGVARSFSGVLVAYFLAALGKAFLNGTVNAYVAASPKRPLGQMYACNAIGAFVAPFVCQTLLARGIPWAHFYLGSLSLSIINTTLLALSFRPTRKDYLAEDSEGSLLESVRSDAQFSMPTDVSEVKTTEKGTGFTRNPTCPETLGSKEEFSRSSTPSPSVKQIQSTLRYALKLRYVWAFSFFIWIYSGSETSTQGYMATYLLVVRGANPNTAGYVTSGFWAGVAISRFITGIATPYLSFTFRKHALHCTL
ncbi:MFS general substrate transporter [Pyrrhoderma noxium]|uniref:MFS general substrate transporter n=1 Tax=Pyrrhoderma noxium TaxID=2282107 RepID=A0A286UQN9_9AGAM|nr:MFS general substrate transporter [Pyrrhoderma noxium]